MVRLYRYKQYSAINNLNSIINQIKFNQMTSTDIKLNIGTQSNFQITPMPPNNGYFTELIKNGEIPVKLSNFLQCLQKIANQNSNQINKPNTNERQSSFNHNEHKYYCRGFANLTKNQQSQLLVEIKRRLNFLMEKKDRILESESDIVRFNCLIRIKTCRISQWEQSQIIIDRRLKKILLNHKNYPKFLLLNDYIARRSKVYSQCVGFECVNFTFSDKFQDLRLRFAEQQKQEFQKFERMIVEINADATAQYLYKQISGTKKLLQANKQNREKVYVFLNDKNLSQLNKIKLQRGVHFKEQPLEKDMREQYNILPQRSSLDNYSVVKKDISTTIEVNEINKSSYRAKLKVKPIKNLGFQNFLYLYQNKHKMINKINILERRSSKRDNFINQLIAIYHKFVWKDRVYGQMMIAKQENNQNQNQEIQHNRVFTLFDIDDPSNISFIQHLQLTIKPMNQTQLQVCIFTKFYKRKYFDETLYLAYLQTFRAIFQQGSLIASHYTETKTISKDLMLLGYEKQRSLETTNLPRSLQSDSREVGQRIGESKSYLKVKHRLYPTDEKIGIKMTEHFLWRNWRRDENGGLVCANEEIATRQKEVAKIVLVKFGKQILKLKNIINFSLPVLIFKKQSHLESIARSQLYAPVFIQKAAAIKDPLERMKSSIIIMMTENALSIHMEKPFNPILGETFQGWVDGCPIYLEQISHHPPVSAYYMVGRGYRKYGSIQPKINFSLNINKGSGFSSNPHFVQFDDGMKIQYICAKITVGGLFIGDRTFTFEDKIYAYDKKHRYFSSMKFGPVDQGVLFSSNQPADYFHGFIYEVSPEFQVYFNSNSPKPHPQQHHIIRKLVQFDGIWNSYVNINKQRVVDFRTDLPYQFEVENCPLASDSRYRRDLINLLRDDMDRAQEEKEVMQEQQRNDRRLREQYLQKFPQFRQ